MTLLSLLLVFAALADVDPHHSYDKLVSANGRSVVVLNGDNSNGPIIDVFSDHLYQQYDAGSEETRDLLYDSYFGMRGDAHTGWLTASSAYGYEQGTGIITIDRSAGELTITEYVFAPLTLDVPAFVHLVQLTPTGGNEVALQLFSLHNFHLGQDSDGDGAHDDDEALWAEDGTVLSEWGSGSGLGMRYLPLDAPTTTGCSEVWSAVSGGADLSGDCGTQSARTEGDDLVGGYQWSLSVGAREQRTTGVVQAFFSNWDSSDVVGQVDAWIAGRDAATILADERADWADWLADGTTPDGLTEDELSVYRQQLVTLKMGQVVEEGDAYGQLPASLPLAAGSGGFSHTWNIAWVRDGAYAIRGLTEAGYLDEAEAALAFLLQDKAGDYSDYVQGLDYSVSACRCYGDGSEWSDADHNGPNVEFDNFGLLLWALGEWVDDGGDIAFVQDRQTIIFDKLADVLAQLIEQESNGTGLIIADSSIWERHWNGQQKHFTYSSTWAVRGLREAADLAEALGDTERADGYRSTADGVAEAMCTWLRDEDGALAGNLEELQQGWGYDDLAAVDAFTNGSIDAAGSVATASFARWDEHLAVPSGHGYRRNDDGDAYDEQEWIMVDLRMAEARRRGCDAEAGQAIEDWITQQALLNNNIIPELLDPSTGDYNGPAPMMGFGAGMYVLALHNRDDAAADCSDGVAYDCEGAPVDTGLPDDSDPPDDTGPSDSDPPGDSDCGPEDSEPPGDTAEDPGDDTCGCSTTPGRGAALLLLLAGTLLQRRRRQ
jgi:MYXO-CTERM domain-containing protein